MEAAFIEILKQVPSLGVLAWIVTYFLRHIETQNRTFLDRFESIVKQFNQVHAEHLEARALSRAAIHENTVALAQVRETIHQCRGGDNDTRER